MEGNIDLSFVYVCLTAAPYAHTHDMAKINLLDCVDLYVCSGNKVSSFVFRISEREGCRPLCDSVHAVHNTDNSGCSTYCSVGILKAPQIKCVGGGLG